MPPPPLPATPHSAAAYEAATEHPQQLLLLTQRITLATEFVANVRSGALGKGVLLSGPNGVGKSGIGLLSYLLCAARRQLVVYLGEMETWVQAAQRGGGDAFLLEIFWKQNADLIAASPLLRDVFAAALRDDTGAFTPDTMAELRAAAELTQVGVGVILDEVQHITAAVQRSTVSGSTPDERTAGAYFRLNWHDWMNRNTFFARMSIASAHGERDYKLPSGEEHRVHIVEPLTDRQRVALLSHPASPAFVRDAAARERIVFSAGNVLRTLMDVARDQPHDPVELGKVLSFRLSKHSVAMRDSCARWWESLTIDERSEAAESTLDLLAGNVSWENAKGLYDAGIMYRTADSPFLRPVSPAAASAYLTIAAKFSSHFAKPLSSFADGRQRGFELEKQLLTRISNVRSRRSVSAKLLNGHPGTGLTLRSFVTQPFDALSEVVPREVPVLYRPLSLTYPCDGILVPTEEDEDNRIIVIECSTTDPRNADRVTKVLKYFEPAGVISELARSFPARPRVVALVWDGELTKVQELKPAAAALSRGEPPSATPVPRAGVVTGARAPATPSHSALASVCVLDRASLVMLGGIVF